jgi:hypothetical protein
VCSSLAFELVAPAARLDQTFYNFAEGLPWSVWFIMNAFRALLGTGAVIVDVVNLVFGVDFLIDHFPFRASLMAIAIAWRRDLTLGPRFEPDRNLPCLNSCITV